MENNAEHWSALLLSLRELIEWVIRKDTELSGLGPAAGDVASLHKQQVNSMLLPNFLLFLYIYYIKFRVSLRLKIQRAIYEI